MNQDFTKYPFLCRLADEVMKFEGGGPGHNNPGNIRCPVTNTAVWNHHAIGETAGFCNFSTPEVGIYALREKFYNICTSQSATYNEEGWKNFHVAKCENLTFYQVVQIYAPVQDHNDPLHYATVVSGRLGIGLDFVMKNFLQLPPKPVPPPPVPTTPVPTPSQPLPPSNQQVDLQQSLSALSKALQWVKSIFGLK